jgi:putative DNA primase/helicase
MNVYSKPPYKICEVGESSDGALFLEVEVPLRGSRKRMLIPVRDLHAGSLGQLGLPLLTASLKNRFLDEAQGMISKRPTFRVATKSGWSGNVFVLPDQTCLPATSNVEVCLSHELRRYGRRFQRRGDMESWNKIPELARSNSRFMLATALAFTGPVVDALNVEPPMVQLSGRPGCGKSSIAKGAGAIWGGDSTGVFLQTWNSTENNLEREAAAHHCTFLVLDETGTAESVRGKQNSILPAIMRLAEGQMRHRLTDTEEPLSWTTPILSTSNKTLDEMAIEDGFEITDAHRGRMIDVPTAVDGVGAFENLHGLSKDDFLDQLRTIAHRHHGHAARKFLSRFAAELKENGAEVRSWLKDRRRWYLQRIRKRISSERDLERVHQKFATIYAAGALAIDYKILPWPMKELSKALFTCEQAHVDHVSRFVSSAPSVNRRPRPVDPFDSLRQHVLQNRSKFVDLRNGLVVRSTGHNHDSCPGYVNQGPDGSVELLFSDAILRQLCGGFARLKQLKDELDKRGWLIREANRGVTRRPIWKDGGRGNRLYVTAVREKAFEDE